MTSLYELARKAVGVHIDKYGDTPAIWRRAELEDLVMRVAREYHEGECEALAAITCSHCQSVLPCYDGLTLGGYRCQHPCYKGRTHEQLEQPTSTPGRDDSEAGLAI